MKSNHFFSACAVALGTTLMVDSATVFAAPAKYIVTLLGTATGGGMYQAMSINNLGQVAGYDGSSALLWTPTQVNGTVGSTLNVVASVGFPSGSISSTTAAVNDLGDVIGTSVTSTGNVGWEWQPQNGGMTTVFPSIGLPHALAPSPVYPIGMNNLGQIVARTDSYQALLFTPFASGGATGTWSFDATESNPPTSINDAGLIAGVLEGYSAWIPYLTPGIPGLDAEYLDGDLFYSPLWASSNEYAIGRINQSGHIAVTASVPNPPYVNVDHAFFYENGVATDISLNQISQAYTLNDSDQVVGAVYDEGVKGIHRSSYPSDATLFEKGRTINLNLFSDAAQSPVSWHFSYAMGINNAGQIVCNGTYTDGTGSGPAAFLLTPKKEP